MSAHDLNWLQMGLALLALGGSIAVYRFTRVNLVATLLVSSSRMTIQLVLVGLYLTFLFQFNHPVLNAIYILFMMGAANFALLKNSGMNRGLFVYTFPALLFAIGTTITYFITLVFTPNPIYNARTLIPIAGMLLGNSMNRSIVTMERFYSSVKKDQEGYAALIAMGATVHEATAPYLKSAFKTGLAPSLANLATMGIVSLPGMMTGQILGGSDPMVAIKYQVAIIVAIYVSTDISSLLSIVLSRKKGFYSTGFLNPQVFKK